MNDCSLCMQLIAPDAPRTAPPPFFTTTWSVASRASEGIACIAPLLGAFGTAVGLMNAVAVFYRLSAFERGETAGSPADAFVLIVLSLPVAILACGGFHYLMYQAATLDFEMRVATLDLLNNLARFHRARG